MLKESTKVQFLLKEEVLQIEIDLKEHLKDVYGALDKENIELDERICEKSEIEFELQILKSFVEHLKNDLEESLVMRKELENSLLAQIDFSESLKQEIDSLVYKLKEKENKIDYLQQHVFIFEQEPKVNETQASVPTSGEMVEMSYLHIIEEKDRILEEFQKEVLRLEQESLRREIESDAIAKSKMDRANELGKKNPINFIEGKNMRTDQLMQHVNSLEQKFTSFLTSFSSQLFEKQVAINQVQEACDKITTAEVLAALEVEEKRLMIEELEYDIHDIENKLKLQEEKWNQTEQRVLNIQAEYDAKQLRIKELSDQTESKLRGSNVFLQKLKTENRSLLENATRLLEERENLLCNKMCECNAEDTQLKLMDTLRNTVQYLENDFVEKKFKNDGDLLLK